MTQPVQDDALPLVQPHPKEFVGAAAETPRRTAHRHERACVVPRVASPRLNGVEAQAKGLLPIPVDMERSLR
jgi:hypothetical protein